MDWIKDCLERLADFTRILFMSVGEIQTAGFIEGKASIAHVLVSASPFLPSDLQRVAETMGKSLINEAMKEKTDDISFKKGLSGIDFEFLIHSDYYTPEVSLMDLLKVHHSKILSKVSSNYDEIDILKYLCAYDYERYLQLIHEIISFYSESIRQLMSSNNSQENRISTFELVLKIRHFLHIYSEIDLNQVLTEFRSFITDYTINVSKGTLPADFLSILYMEKCTHYLDVPTSFPFQNINLVTPFWTLPLESQIAMIRLLPNNMQMRRLLYSLYVKRPLSGIEVSLKRTCANKREMLGRERGICAIMEMIIELLNTNSLHI